MKKPDFRNSDDLLCMAHDCPDADSDALGLAHRLTFTKEDVGAAVIRLTDKLHGARRRELFWSRVSLLGLATLVPGVLAGMLLVFGVNLPAEYVEMVGGLVGRWIPILGILFWLFIASTVSVSAVEERTRIEAELGLLQPLGAPTDWEAALYYVEAGRPEVLAWRDIALRERKELYLFDVAVLRALHNVSMAARPAEELASAAETARQQLYGTNDAAPAPSA